jgi:LacI family transcriptional regulator
MKNNNISIRKIAEKAGVSIASVSNALNRNGSSHVSSKLRKRILDVCEQMKYQPNEHTRRMLAKRANTVAIFFPATRKMASDTPDYFININFGTCMIGAQAALTKHGIDLLLVEASPEFISSKGYINKIRGRVIDGILLWGITNTDSYVHDLLKENVPVVLLQTIQADCNCSKIVADDFAGACGLVERLLKAGHREIAVIKPPSSSSTGIERMRGIVAALKKANMEAAYITKCEGYGRAFGISATVELLEQSNRFSCIIAPNDMTAWGCIDELKKHKLNVPRDISIAGADGWEMPGDTHISSFYSPSYNIGKVGAEVLMRHINGNSEIEYHCLPVSQVAGNTIKNIKLRNT